MCKVPYFAHIGDPFKFTSVPTFSVSLLPPHTHTNIDLALCMKLNGTHLTIDLLSSSCHGIDWLFKQAIHHNQGLLLNLGNKPHHHLVSPYFWKKLLPPATCTDSGFIKFFSCLSACLLLVDQKRQLTHQCSLGYIPKSSQNVASGFKGK